MEQATFDRVWHQLAGAEFDKRIASDDAKDAFADAAERYGIHKAAWRFVMKLDRLEPGKMADFLRAFDEYRMLRNLDAQGDIVDQSEALSNTPTEEEAEGMGYEHARAGLTLETIPENVYAKAPLVRAFRRGFAKFAVAEPRDQDQPGLPLGGVETQGEGEGDVGAAAEPETDADWRTGADGTDAGVLDQSGAIFNAGAAAGRAGAGKDANPHGARSNAGRLWEKGRKKGAAEGGGVDAVATASEPAEA